MAAAMQRWGLACQKRWRECFICLRILGVHVKTHGVLDQFAASIWAVCVTFQLAWFCIVAWLTVLCWSHSVMGASAWWKIWRRCFILSIPAWYKLHHVPCVLQSTWCATHVQHIHIGPCVMYLTECFIELLPGSQFLFGACICTVRVIFCGLKAQSHSDDSHVVATAPGSVRLWFCSCSPRNVMHSSTLHRVTATLLVAGLTLTLWIPGQTMISSTSLYAWLVQRLPVNVGS